MIITIKPKQLVNDQSGLAKEGFTRLPGTGERVKPIRVGNRYLTTLDPDQEINLKGVEGKEREALRKKIKKEVEDIEALINEDLSTQAVSDPNAESFWRDRSIWLTDGGLRLDTDDPWHRVDLSWLIMLPQIAKDKNEADKNPDVQWYIADSMVDASIRRKRKDEIDKARRILKEMLLDGQRKIARLMSVRFASDHEDSIYVALDDFISKEDTPANTMLFLSLAEMSAESLELRTLVSMAIEHSVMKHNIGRKTVDFGDLSMTQEDWYAYLTDPENAQVRLAISSRLKESSQLPVTLLSA